MTTSARPIGAAVPPKAPRPKRRVTDPDLEVRAGQRRAAAERMQSFHRLRKKAAERLRSPQQGGD